MRSVDRILRHLASGDHAASAPAPVVLIDGFSGAGKTTLAWALRSEWTARTTTPVQLLRLDDVYPGWDGLAEAHEHLLARVLEPLRRGDPARWRGWDWQTDVATGWNDVSPESPLIVEGAGSLSARSRALADLGVWIALDAATRKARALDRDGDTYASNWHRWARQERAFFEREHPGDHADIVIDGALLLDLGTMGR